MRKARLAMGLLLLAGPVGVYSCRASDQAPTEATRQARPVHYLVLREPYFSASPQIAERIRSAEERYAWVWQLHGEAVREAHAERLTWPIRDRGSRSRICSQAMTMGLKYAAKANVAAGKPAGTDSDNLPTVLRGLRMANCTDPTATARSMSVFATSANPLAALAAVPVLQSSAGEAWMNAVVAAFESSGPLGGDIASAVNGVLVGAAAELSGSDFDGVVGTADMALGSLIEWQAVWDSGNWQGGGGGGGGGGEDPMLRQRPKPMSVFSAQWIPWFDAYILFAFDPHAQSVAKWDAAGFAGGWLGGPQIAAALAAISSIAAY